MTDTLENGKNLYVKDDKIFALTTEELEFNKEIDANGAFVSPGFIDIHTHGAGGFDFTDGVTEDILSAALAHARFGTTTVFPTSPSMSFTDTMNFVQNVKEAMAQNTPGKPYVAGAHLEGPYFSMSQRGAQNPEYIKPPERAEYEKLVEVGCIRRISYAPELEGSTELCRFLSERGIVSAFAHTDGIYEEIKPLIDMGCRLATHLYSGMNTVTRRLAYRRLGAVETALLEDSVCVEVIADGCHLPTELLKLIYKIKGPERICLVTDSMRGAGMDEGPSILGPKHDGVDCIIRDGVAFMPDMTSFAGSVATADRLVRVMYKKVGIPLPETIKMITETPARIMGEKLIGSIKEGYFADLVFFDDNVNIKKVIIKGVELE